MRSEHGSPLTIDEAPDGALVLRGALTVSTAGALWSQLSPRLGDGQQVSLDLEGLTEMDSAGIATLAEGSLRARSNGGRLRVMALRPEHEPLLARAVVPPEPPPPPARRGVLEAVGAWGWSVGQDTRRLAVLLRDVLRMAVSDPLRGRARGRLDETVQQALRMGADALVVVTLIALLLGLVMAFQAARELEAFGANIYVADLVAMTMLRELGPMITAIVVVGRSGSAMTAELGTMVVREEIDAMRVMGLDPVRFLVVPRFLAITLAVPALTIFADFTGLLGGFATATSHLDITPRAYITQTIHAVDLGDFLMGLFKSVLFAWVIVLVSATRGLGVETGADAVGRATTRAVVAGIFLIVVVDSIVTTGYTLWIE